MARPSAPPSYKLKLPKLTFLFCLLVAGILWLITEFSKEYTVTMDYAIHWQDFPSGKEEIHCADSVLSLSFNARGFAFLRPCYRTKNRVANLSLKQLLKNRNVGEIGGTYAINRRKLTEYLHGQKNLDPDFVEVTAPDIITIYLK